MVEKPGTAISGSRPNKGNFMSPSPDKSHELGLFDHSDSVPNLTKNVSTPAGGSNTSRKISMSKNNLDNIKSPKPAAKKNSLNAHHSHSEKESRSTRPQTATSLSSKSSQPKSN